HERLSPCRAPGLKPQRRAGLAALLPALGAFAALGLEIGFEIIVAVVVCDLFARLDAPDRAQKNAVAARVGFGVRPARVVGIATEIAARRAIDRPTAVEFIKVYCTTRLKLCGLFGRQQSAGVIDDELALLDLRGGKEAESCPRTADTEWSTCHDEAIRVLAARSGRVHDRAHQDR